MATPATLPISDIVDVTVLVSPQSVAQPTFNQGLIVGPSTHITTTQRIKQYTTLDQMAADGFLTTDPEYICAQLYFAQSPAPQVLFVGVHDTANESILDAIKACQAINPSWWAVMATDAVKADHQAIAAWAETAAPSVGYFYTTSDSDVPTGTAGNILLLLQALQYKRTIGIYATTQSDAFPNNIYAAAAAMGAAMGRNTGLANSFYTMKFKGLVGIAIEPLTPTQVATIESANGNVFINRGGFLMLEQGVMASGQYFDEIINLDMLASDIQYSVMNLLYDNPSIPQTDPGEALLIHVVNEACERARTRGFVSDGVWDGPTVLKLVSGMPLPNGYLAQAQPYSQMSKADRQARKAQPIYVAIIESGAVHFVTIAVLVQR